MNLKYFIWGGSRHVYNYCLNKYGAIGGKIIAAPVTEWCKTEKGRIDYLDDLSVLNMRLEEQEIAVKPSSFGFDYDRVSPLIREGGTNIWNFDAEESWTKDDYHLLMNSLIGADELRVRKCYQAYLRGEYEVLLNDLKTYGEEYSIRLVRGAYHQLEMKEMSGAVFEKKEDTDDQFREMMHYLFYEVKNPVMIATHNKEDVAWLKGKLQDKHEKRERVKIGQLMGMNDGGEEIVEYVPYGDLRNAIPYLSRRLIENRSMLRHLL